MSSAKKGQDSGGEYEYYDIKDYDTCCSCEQFSDNWHEERFECLRSTEECPRCCGSDGYLENKEENITGKEKGK